MKTLPFVPYYKTHLHYTAKLHKKQGIILVWSPNGGRSLARRTESCLPGEGTRRRTPRFPPSCESSTFLRGHGEICRAETIGERQSGYSTVHFVKYSQFTDRLLLHRWFTLRRARHNSAAQLVYTLLRLSPTNKSTDKHYLQGAKFLLYKAKPQSKRLLSLIHI